MQASGNITHFQAQVSKQRTWLIIGLAFGFAALGIWFATSAAEISQSVRLRFFRDPAVLRVFGWAACVIGIGGAAIALRELLRSEPVIEVDANGILWRRWSNKMIPWSSITDVTTRAMSGQRFLCLTLDRPGDYKSRSLTGLLAGMNKSMGFSDIAISMQGSDRSFDELVEAVSRLRPAARR